MTRFILFAMCHTSNFADECDNRNIIFSLVSREIKQFVLCHIYTGKVKIYA